MIRSVQTDDAFEICRIYNYYVENTIVTFQEEPVTIATMENNIKTSKSHFPWLVYEESGEVLGYARAGRWSDKNAYRFTVESSIYVDREVVGKGIGSKLYKVLLSRLEENEFHSVQALIALPNPVSILLHEKLGFEKNAHFREVGFKFGKWVDVGCWEKLL